MLKFMFFILSFFKISRFVRNQSGVSAIEFALLFPVLFAMLMAIYDLGQGIIVNQKTVAASQVIGDLISRNEVVDVDLIDDITQAGRLALRPYDTTPYGYDIVSVEFDEDGSAFELWRVTDNMDENSDALSDAEGLGEEGQGVVVVSVVYEYEPLFASFVVDSFDMMEVAFLAGRKSPTVTCADCP